MTLPIARRKSGHSPKTLRARLRHTIRRKHYTHITLQSRILPLYRSIPYSLLLFHDPDRHDPDRQRLSNPQGEANDRIQRTSPHFLPCPPPRTAALQYASWVNLRGIVWRVLADAETCVRLWEGMSLVEARGWVQGRKHRSLDEQVAKVAYWKRGLLGVEGRCVRVGERGGREGGRGEGAVNVLKRMHGETVDGGGLDAQGWSKKRCL